LFPTAAKRFTRRFKKPKAGDVVLIAGKGHETYQIVGNEKFHFDDREIAREALEAKWKIKNGKRRMLLIQDIFRFPFLIFLRFFIVFLFL
jgi:hypothetical protein